MRCPVCAKELVPAGLEQRGLGAVQTCPACRGCWLDAAGPAGEPSLWADADEVPVNEEEALAQLACPRCQIQLVTVTPVDHAELAIEKCPTCHGFWLDSGELAKLRAVSGEYLATHGERPAGWSALKWLVYRLAHWHRHPA